MSFKVKSIYLVFLGLLLALFQISEATSCTGISLKAQNGTKVYGRTMEWGAFDLNSRVTIIPRGFKNVGTTMDGKPGHKWISKYNVVGLDMLKKNVLADGINEKGLAAGLFYHPGFAEYPVYDPKKADQFIAPTEVVNYILENFATIDEVIKGMRKIQVGAVLEPAIKKPVDAHFMVTEPSGKSIVIEFAKRKIKFFPNPLGVITNAPNFDWHITNLRNYVNLSPVALPSKKIEDLDFKPLGGGSGLIGLPGDYTPPSRFIRAVAFTQTARVTQNGLDAITEIFRILDNFNLPLGAAEGSDHSSKNNTDKMKSSTIWTSGWDLKNLVLYYHTQHNRRIRKLDLKKIDFDSLKGKMKHIPMDKRKVQDILEIKP